MAGIATWDVRWDDVYRDREWGKYPNEELIRFVARNYYKVADRSAVRFLDIGCGYGAATWYLAREGFCVDGIDGSAVAIELLCDRLAESSLTATLSVGDLSALPYDRETFDCAVDVVSLMCNSLTDTRRILAGVMDCMKPGARLFSFTPSAGCWGDGIGDLVDDCTYDNAADGPFAGTGRARFSSEAQIRSLYGMFEELVLDRSTYTVGGGRLHVILDHPGLEEMSARWAPDRACDALTVGTSSRVLLMD